MTVPANAKQSFTYSLVITEGYATQPSMVQTETITVVSTEDLELSVNYPATYVGAGLPFEVFFQVLTSVGVPRPVNFDSAVLLKDGQSV